jgi:hypothetical protein
MQTESEVKASFKLLLVASAITVAIWFIPYAELLLYPFRLFVTFVHEAGHALAALGTFGSVRRISLDWNGNGLTETAGGARLLISSAGYLSTTVYGAALLLLLQRVRYARMAAGVTAALLLLITILFGGNLLAWLAGLAFAAGLIVMALKARPRVVHFFMSFLAVQSILNAFFDLRTLMYLSMFQPGVMTDAQNMAAATGGFIPGVVWAVGWSMLSVGILGTTLYFYYRSLDRAAIAGGVRSLPSQSFPRIDSTIN